MKKFEYKILDVPTTGWLGVKVDYQALADKLNEVGRQGWEAISMGSPNKYDNASRNIIIILKREIN